MVSVDVGCCCSGDWVSSITELFSCDLQRLSDFVSLRGQRGGAWAEEVV
jgi:hypothetical protein